MISSTFGGLRDWQGLAKLLLKIPGWLPMLSLRLSVVAALHSYLLSAHAILIVKAPETG